MGLFDLFKKGNSPSPEKLIKATKKGKLELVTSLLEVGTNVNCKDEEGWTPLMWASSPFSSRLVSFEERPELIKLLLEKGADVNVKNKKGRTALINASANGNGCLARTVKMLIDAGADINAIDKFGRTALTFASENNRAEIVKILIDAGADINVRDQRGYTALRYALYAGWGESVKMLMDAGAQADTEDKDAALTLINGHTLPPPESTSLPEFAKKHDISIVIEVEESGGALLQISAHSCTINWGDDSSENEYTDIRDKKISHSYKAGSYTITVDAAGLSEFECHSRSATAIYLNNCPQLESLTSSFNDKLATLDISRCTALRYLSCSWNKLTALDVSNNLALKHLSCSKNLLTALDISKNTQLRNVDCSENQLSILNVTRNNTIAQLRCNDNQLSIHELHTIFNHLPNYNSSYGTVQTWYAGSTSRPEIFIACAGNPGFNKCNAIIALKKNWLVWGRAIYIAATIAGTPGRWQQKF